MVTLTFEAEAEKSYSVEAAESVTSTAWNVITNVPAAPTSQIITVHDPSANGQVQRSTTDW